MNIRDIQTLLICKGIDINLILLIANYYSKQQSISNYLSLQHAVLVE